MKYSYQDIKESMTLEKKKEDSVIAGFVYRPIANFISLFLVNWGVSANAISICSVVIVLAACFLLLISSNRTLIIAFVLLNLFPVMDCIDGTIARTLKKNNPFGDFFDAVGGYTMYSFSLLFICWASTKRGFVLPILSNDFLFFVSAIGSIFSILPRLIYQRYLVSCFKQYGSIEHSIYEVNNEKKIGIVKRIVIRINRFIGIGDGYMIILSMAYCLGVINWAILFYSIYFVFLGVSSSLLYCIKASRAIK